MEYFNASNLENYELSFSGLITLSYIVIYRFILKIRIYDFLPPRHLSKNLRTVMHFGSD